jgi:hypothetical protein
VRIVGVQQILDWRVVPIKRIDRIEVGALAHRESDRTKVAPLQVYDFKKKDPAASPTAATDATTAAQPGAGVPGSPAGSPGFASPGGEQGGMGGKGGPGMGGTGGGDGPLTENHKIPLRRYYELTDEVRRVPVAVVLIVDISNINDVLSAFANSRLRFQVTQAVWNRVPSIGKPAFASSSPASSGAGKGSSAPGAPGGDEGPGFAAGPGRGQPPTGPSGSTGTGTGQGQRPAISVEEETNQVELQVYGLITLYESPDAWQRIAETRAKLASTPAAASAAPAAPAK